MSHPQFDVGDKPPAPGPGEGFYPEPPKKQRGCLFYGCLVASIVAGVGLLLFIALTVTLLYFANQMINQWTSTTPVPVPVVSLTADQEKSIQERFDAFKKAIDEGREAELVLNTDDLNYLITREPKLKGKIYAKITGDQVSAQISIPLGDLKVPGLSGRYLNGNGSFDGLVDEDGELVVHLRELEVNGKKLPDDAKRQLAGENLAKNFLDDPDNRKTIRKIKSFTIKDDKIRIVSRAQAKEGDEEKDAEKDAPAKGEAPNAGKSEPGAAVKAGDAKGELPPAGADSTPPAKAGEPKPADAPPREESTKKAEVRPRRPREAALV